VSLSAGELVLPTIGSDGRISSGTGGDKRSQGLVKQVYAAVGNWITDSMQALGWSGATSSGGGRYTGGYTTNRYQ
jgi:hypothetical protein